MNFYKGLFAIGAPCIATKAGCDLMNECFFGTTHLVYMPLE